MAVKSACNPRLMHSGIQHWARITTGTLTSASTFCVVLELVGCLMMACKTHSTQTRSQTGLPDTHGNKIPLVTYIKQVMGFKCLLCPTYHHQPLFVSSKTQDFLVFHKLSVGCWCCIPSCSGKTIQYHLSTYFFNVTWLLQFLRNYSCYLGCNVSLPK